MKRTLQSIAILLVGILAYGLLLFIEYRFGRYHFAGFSDYREALLGFTDFRRDFGIASLVYFGGLVLHALMRPLHFIQRATWLRRSVAVSGWVSIVAGGFYVFLLLQILPDELGP